MKLSRERIKKIQTALKLKGFPCGPIDGIIGRKTTAAMLKFLKNIAASTRNIFSEENLKHLTNKPQVLAHNRTISKDIPSWYQAALDLKGTREISGRRSNKKILQWAAGLGSWVRNVYTNDDIPWCGLFNAHCIKTKLPNEVLPRNVLGARNWATFGHKTTPRLGAILVFWRGSRKGWKGHVGFYAGEDTKYYYVLGGNQSNSVSITKISKNRLLAARWPETGGYTFRGTKVFMTKRDMKVSNNEA